MDATASLGGHPQRAASTVRTDRWWIAPATTIAVLGGFVVYATWAALQGNHYFHHPYLSPFYSPVLWTDSSVPGSAPPWHAVFGELPGWWPGSLPFSPALFILVFPGAFRFTCYYYRKAYYRAFFADPVACAVGEPRKGYTGETKFPFVLQNIHRYLIYLAIPILFFLWVDIVKGFIFDGRFGIGVGSLVLLVSNTLLTLYTFSCHSIRHLVGGRVDCFSCVVAGGPRHQVWQTSTWLNEHHMAWAWWSLFAVCGADLYIRLLSQGVITDWRLL